MSTLHVARRTCNIFRVNIFRANIRPGDFGSLTAMEFEILLSLAGGDLHGYAIIQDVAARTDGEVRLTASTLYAAIKRLLESGLIEPLYSAFAHQTQLTLSAPTAVKMS